MEVRIADLSDFRCKYANDSFWIETAIVEVSSKLDAKVVNKHHRQHGGVFIVATFDHGISNRVEAGCYLHSKKDSRTQFISPIDCKTSK